MRATLWLLALFGMAVTAALFVGGNPGTITLFWPPHRIDLSLNLAVLLLALLFLLLHLALRALAALFAMPAHARLWRVRHHERAMQLALLDALSNFVAGRFLRARKGAEAILEREIAIQHGGELIAHAGRLRVLAHLLAAESAQALQDSVARECHFRQALEQSPVRDEWGSREGLLLRAARWALEVREPQAALQWLDSLAQGAARRTVALRLRLKAARMAGHTRLALETARLLVKHRAFPEEVAQALLRGLAQDLIAASHDPDQLQAAWNQLEPCERELPEVSIAASNRMCQLGGDAHVLDNWLLPVWERMTAQPGSLTDAQRLALIDSLEKSCVLESNQSQSPWLRRVEQAQKANPGDPALQYLAGVTFMRLQLWGKAQQLLEQAVTRLPHIGLKRKAWVALAELAEQRSDSQASLQAWKNAGKT